MSNVGYAINRLNNSVESFSGNVSAHVSNVDQTSRQIEATANNIYKEVATFRQTMEQSEQTQIAHENIIRIDQVIKERFGNYEAIRKTILGVVRDFDINLVRNSTVEELSEELWITSSRYWLSYALLAVTAWVNNYPDVAKNALAESSRKDAIKTSLFFCLLNLRFERIGTAREWFKVYCKTLDPTMLQQETAVMIQAYMNGVFGKDKQLEHEVVSILDDWIRVISEDAQLCEKLVGQYEAYFTKFHTNTEFRYDMISEFLANSNEVKQAYVDVSKYDRLIALVDSLNVDEETRTDENYKSRVDAVLMDLISKFDEEEQEIRREQEYFNLVVQNAGKIDEAKKQHDEYIKNATATYNIGQQMVNWVVYDGKLNVHVRKFGLQNTKDWFVTALENYTTNLRSRCPVQYQFAIDGWTSNSNGRDLDEQRQSLKNYFEGIKFRTVYMNTLNIVMIVLFFVALLIAAVSVVVFFNTFGWGAVIAFLIGLLLMGVAAVGFVLGTLMAKKKYLKRLNKSVYCLENTMAQIVEFQRYFTEHIRKKDLIMEKLMYL